MSKRFTETGKWADPWFRSLPTKMKAFWEYIRDNCDSSGVWLADWDLASFCLGQKVTAQEIQEHFAGRVAFLRADKLLILKFIQFQYGQLSEECKPHKPVFAALRKHGIFEVYLKGFDTLTIPFRKGMDTLQYKEQDQDKEKGKEKDQEGDARGRPGKAVFDESRKAFPGSKRGLDPEWENFTKKNPDYTTILPLLLPAIEREKAHKAALNEANQFCPQWKNFTTWINGKCWTEEFPAVVESRRNGSSKSDFGSGIHDEIHITGEA